jgi:hypothetical protein
MIKQYLVYGRFYAGWTKHQGRYTFRIMYREHDESSSYHYRHEPIGYEMYECNRAYGAASNDESWVLRIYVDGTALFRPWKLHPLRYPASRCIHQVLEYFFYQEGEVRDTAGRGHIKLLRRRVQNPYQSRPQQDNFGEFLESKYNTQHRGR